MTRILLADDQEAVRRALLDSIYRSETPVAGHLLYTQVLDDGVPSERARGLWCCMNLIAVATRLAVYADYGITDGMRQAINRAHELGVPVVHREIGQNE